jgi:trafficking protein particle complex subunit 6
MQAKQQSYPSYNNPATATAAPSNRGGGGGPQQAPSLSHSNHMLTTNTTATNQRAVSAQIMEFLLTEISMYAAKSSLLAATATTVSSNPSNNNTTTSASTGTGGSNSASASAAAAVALHKVDEEESLTVAAEMAAAKLERMGAAVGYRITERLAETKTWNATTTNSTTGTTATTNDQAAALVAAQQLEAVKFLCKDVWIEIFNKQIDKLQTNHRGVFVLKDLNLSWLTRFPVGSETSRVSALRLLAFPCGVVRGALANLGIPAVVSCEFLADGQNMAACSFNIKVK